MDNKFGYQLVNLHYLRRANDKLGPDHFTSELVKSDLITYTTQVQLNISFNVILLLSFVQTDLTYSKPNKDQLRPASASGLFKSRIRN